MQTILGPLIDLLTWILEWLYSIGLTWGQAIIGLTVIVRLAIFPITWRQYKSTQALQALQPKIKELQQRYKNDRGKLQEETMKLYQEHRVNPFASCLPLLLQLPIFISLYYTIRSEPAIQASTFLGIPLGEPSILLLIIYVITQIISTELMLVTQSDKTQKMIMRAMPLIFVVFLWNFPAGLFVYWITTNVWTIGQQLAIRRLMPKPDADELARRAAEKPKKRSRFMDAVLQAQEQRMGDREKLLEKKGQTQGAGGKQGAGKQGGAKQGAGQGAEKQGGAKQGGGKGQQAGAKKGGRPPGKPKGKQGQR
jgi:YidC/Oxa1 family membrane protein insertase